MFKSESLGNVMLNYRAFIDPKKTVSISLPTIGAVLNFFGRGGVVCRHFLPAVLVSGWA